MKVLKTCPILIVIVAIAIALSVTSYALEDTVYSEYAYDYQPDKAPHFIMVFKGLTDGVLPWSEAASAVPGESELADGSSDTADQAESDGAQGKEAADSETAQIVIAGEKESLVKVSDD